ncbi:ATP synthase F1 subunit epsilon [Buchnera aphidicola (Ceratoglyphina bambusae)]|uniref:ATP synthase F1 subunit epsilon n=1 Tax=Buchnera aphidicola TaxID=9 RepID=UPI0031B83625
MCFNLKVASIEKKIFFGNVLKIILSGILGDMCIYPKHSPLLTYIKPCVLYILKSNNKKKYFYLYSGILEIQPNYVIILSDITVLDFSTDKNFILSKKDILKKIVNSDINNKNRILLLDSLSRSIDKFNVIEGSNK